MSCAAAPLCIGLLAPVLHTRRRTAAECASPSEGAPGRGLVERVPLFVVSGVSCFLPHSGAQELQLYEPHYVRMHRDLVGGVFASKPVIAAAHGGPGGGHAPVGILLELVDWKPLAPDPAPRIYARYAAGPRVRIRRTGGSGAHGGDGEYLVAEIERIDDSPALANHSEARRGLQAVWELLARLVELQERARERPRLTAAALALGRTSGVLSASDVWRPISLMQELHLRQASAIHSKYGARIAAAFESGAPAGELQSAYAADLGAVRLSLEAFPPLLQADSAAQALDDAAAIILSEIHRLEALLAAQSE